MTNLNIVFVDEAIHEIQPYIFAMQIKGANVVLCENADECAYICKQKMHTDLFLVDVMLRSEKIFSKEDTQFDLYTGLLLARVIREFFPEVPIVFFSGMNFEDGLRYINETIKVIGNAALVRKKDAPNPIKFADIVLEMAKNKTAKHSENTVVRLAVDSVIVRPSLFGVGFDVMKFIERVKILNYVKLIERRRNIKDNIIEMDVMRHEIDGAFRSIKRCGEQLAGRIKNLGIENKNINILVEDIFRHIDSLESSIKHITKK